MPIFSTRSSKRDVDEAPTRKVPIDSIETLRTRARQRLIGAVVLVALGIITFTLLFDSQPRPIPVDIKITMPDKDKPDGSATTTVTAPVTAQAASAEPASVVETPAAVTAAVQASASLSAKEEIVAPKTDKKPEAKSEVKVEAKVEAKPVIKAEPKPEAKPVAKPEVKPEVKPTPKSPTDEAAKALAILEGKEPPKTASTTAAAATGDVTTGRFVVQVGAFAENEKAREARLKVERAGLKTYVHVAETPQGKRIRVRVGPFTTRAEADKAAAKIKTLDLPAAILTL